MHRRSLFVVLLFFGCAHPRPELVVHPAQGWGGYRAFPAQLDHDGRGDLVWNELTDLNRTYVALGAGDGSFLLPPYVDHPRHAWQDARTLAGDVDGDALTDLVFVRTFGDAIAIETAMADGRGGWTFREPHDRTLALASARIDVALGDVTGDGRGDVVLLAEASDRTRTVVAIRGELARVWTAGALLARPAMDARPVDPPLLVGDVNGDQLADVVLIASARDWMVDVLIADGRGGFFEGAPLRHPREVDLGEFARVQAPMTPEALLADVDADGAMDLVMLEEGASGTRVSLARADRRGGFAIPTTYASDAMFRSGQWATGDFDGDGRADLLASFFSGRAYAQVLRADAIGGWTPGELFVGPSIAGSSYRPLVLDVDGDHRADVVWNELTTHNRVHVAFGTDRATLDPRR